VDRTTLLWGLVLFFGASILFGLLRRATEDSSTGVTVAVQVGALVILIAGIAVVVRRLQR
jgi:uncharacterized membrane protein YhaH (DUF805 family)